MESENSLHIVAHVGKINGSACVRICWGLLNENLHAQQSFCAVQYTAHCVLSLSDPLLSFYFSPLSNPNTFVLLPRFFHCSALSFLSLGLRGPPLSHNIIESLFCSIFSNFHFHRPPYASQHQPTSSVYDL